MNQEELESTEQMNLPLKAMAGAAVDIGFDPYLLAKGGMKDELIDLAHFNENLGNNNKIYFPARNGCQCGNHHATLALAKKTVSIMENKIKEREDDE